MATDLHDLSIAELSAQIAARALSPVELVESLIRRVEQYDAAQTHAFITRTFDLARQQARQAEDDIAAGRYRGALHGMPFALKDIYDTKGILTSGHSRIFLDRIPANDATVTARLYAAGAVLLGKLATHEMAHAGPSFDLPWPPARNPWNLAHFTGGSSSGSGAAVAASMVPVALGSDTGGSIRGPASLCGVVGLMPTFGLVSRAGVITNSYTFDHCGPLARTVEDCAVVLDALAGYDPKDSGSLRRQIPRYREAIGPDLRGLRIGVLRHHWEDDIPASEDVRGAMEIALDVLRRLGAELEECRVRPLGQYFDVKIILAESEIFSVHQRDLIARAKDFGADFRSRALPSVVFTAHDYVQATREHRRMMVEMEPLYARFDAFVTAGMGEAPRLADYRSISFWQKPNLLTPWNVTGQPVVALPNGFGRNGLPLGMQILGRPFGETTILRIGHAYEKATEWHTRRPGLVPGVAAPVVTSPPVLSGTAEQTDARTRALCEMAARRAGLELDDLVMAQLLEGAPYALRMVERLRRDHGLHHEPANVFSFPASRREPVRH
jgi:aspartyl-tRNA(Asn)/glutamyl-tRNA(Gln) amidotransferase subunit A